jgi:hypothetical protein
VVGGRRADKGPEEWAEFLHVPGKIFTNFNDVREEIVRDTNAKTGGDKGAWRTTTHTHTHTRRYTHAGTHVCAENQRVGAA